MSDTDHPDAKVVFHVANDDGSFEIETLWAHDLGNDQYKIDNSPLFAYAVSLGDIVYAPVDPEDGRPTFQKIVSKSGNRTVRVVFDSPIQPGNGSDDMVKGLVALGCGYEGLNSRYIAVNIPTLVDCNEVYEYLTRCNAQWEYGDPTYDELYPTDA
jgi:uncharacterized protein DUF4265